MSSAMREGPRALNYVIIAKIVHVYRVALRRCGEVK
jgi:hypothetical protein